MLRLNHLVFVGTALLSVLVGCATTAEDPAPDVAGSEEALTSRPPTAEECSDFVSDHPRRESSTLSTGDVVEVPFRSCDLNTGALFGTIDLAFAKQLTAGSGYVPLTVLKEGEEPKGLARLYFVNYLHTDLGAYNEFIFLVDAVRENASADAKVLKWVNPISSLLPAFHPDSRPITPQLILQKEAVTAIAYGRELLGLDKRAGRVDLAQTSGGMTFAVADETGAPVVRGAFHPDKRLSTLLRTVGKLTGAAVGERLTPSELALKLHPLTLRQPIEVSGSTFARDIPAAGDLAVLKTTNWWLPTMNEVSADTLDFQIDGSSALGKKLLDAHFAPTAFATAEHASLIVTPE